MRAGADIVFQNELEKKMKVLLPTSPPMAGPQGACAPTPESMGLGGAPEEEESPSLQAAGRQGAGLSRAAGSIVAASGVR